MKRTVYTACMLGIGAAMLTAGCSNDPDAEGTKQGEPVRIPLTEETRAMVDNGNGFGMDLLSEVGEATEGNFVISPVSAFMTAAMLANGDNGESRAQIMDALGLEGTDSDLAALNGYCSSLSSSLPKVDGRVTCSLANGAWTDPATGFLDSFAGVLSGSFGAECRNVSPAGEGGRADINGWVDGMTSGMMPEFLKRPLADGTTFAVVNAVYFSGQWQKRFDRAKTGTAVFHNADGSESEHMQMHYSGMAGWIQTEDYTSVALTYGSGNFEMVVAVPAEGNGDMLSKEGLHRWLADLGGMTPADTELRMPRFEAASETDLVDALKGMGITAPFDRGRGLDGVSSLPQHLGTCLQGVRVRVDEEGSEGASGTVAAGGITSPGKCTLTVDRPFIFMIRETTTGAVLFAGRIDRL